MARADQNETDLANRALSIIEAQSIENLDDGTPRAIECRLWFHLVRDALLRALPWNFALRRTSLPAKTVDPAWGKIDGTTAIYAQLPSDCLRVVRVNERETGWRIEGRQIYTTEAPVDILYVRTVADPQQWDPLFAMVFAHNLALAVGPKLAQKTEQLTSIEDNRDQLMAQARRTDGSEKAAVTMPDAPWVEEYQ